MSGNKKAKQKNNGDITWDLWIYLLTTTEYIHGYGQTLSKELYVIKISLIKIVKQININ